MADLIAQVWEGLRAAGLPEVMLYLPDGGASRCHWDATAMIGEVRVALIGDQERGIVRIIPVCSCTGIGVPAPKGIDPLGYRGIVHEKLLGALPPARGDGPPSPVLGSEANSNNNGAVVQV